MAPERDFASAVGRGSSGTSHFPILQLQQPANGYVILRVFHTISDTSIGLRVRRLSFGIAERPRLPATHLERAAGKIHALRGPPIVTAVPTHKHFHLRFGHLMVGSEGPAGATVTAEASTIVRESTIPARAVVDAVALSPSAEGLRSVQMRTVITISATDAPQ